MIFGMLQFANKMEFFTRRGFDGFPGFSRVNVCGGPH